MPGDLHTHTNFSDGSSDIELLPLLARRAGLTSLAVSDHDTELCIQYAQQHPVDQGVRLIPAVEMTGFDTRRGRRVHMLCYCPELTPGLLAFFQLMKDRRNAVTSPVSYTHLNRLSGCSCIPASGPWPDATVPKVLRRRSRIIPRRAFFHVPSFLFAPC